jgi:hypothetical protein
VTHIAHRTIALMLAETADASQDEAARLHFHLSLFGAYSELTILATLDDLERHLTGEIDRLPSQDEYEVRERDTSVIVLTDAVGTVIVFRTRACFDPVCQMALSDFWL